MSEKSWTILAVCVVLALLVLMVVWALFPVRIRSPVSDEAGVDRLKPVARLDPVPQASGAGCGPLDAGGDWVILAPDRYDLETATKCRHRPSRLYRQHTWTKFYAGRAQGTFRSNSPLGSNLCSTLKAQRRSV